MYTVSKAPSKLACKATRRGPMQQIEKFDCRENGLGLGPAANMSSAKPVFERKYFGRSNHANGSTNGSNIRMPPQDMEMCYPQQDESVRYVADSWFQVKHNFEISLRMNREGGPEYYQDKHPNKIQGFQPFDLDQWTMQRTLDKIHKSS